MADILKFPRTIVAHASLEEIVERMEYIVALEAAGDYDGKCRYCFEEIFPQLMQGTKLYNIMAPRHKAKLNCESMMRNHCTCDTCF